MCAAVCFQARSLPSIQDCVAFFGSHYHLNTILHKMLDLTIQILLMLLYCYCRIVEKKVDALAKQHVRRRMQLETEYLKLTQLGLKRVSFLLLCIVLFYLYLCTPRVVTLTSFLVFPFSLYQLSIKVGKLRLQRT